MPALLLTVASTCLSFTILAPVRRVSRSALPSLPPLLAISASATNSWSPESATPAPAAYPSALDMSLALTIWTPAISLSIPALPSCPASVKNAWLSVRPTCLAPSVPIRFLTSSVVATCAVSSIFCMGSPPPVCVNAANVWFLSSVTPALPASAMNPLNCSGVNAREPATALPPTRANSMNAWLLVLVSPNFAASSTYQLIAFAPSILTLLSMLSIPSLLSFIPPSNTSSLASPAIVMNAWNLSIPIFNLAASPTRVSTSDLVATSPPARRLPRLL